MTYLIISVTLYDSSMSFCPAAPAMDRRSLGLFDVLASLSNSVRMTYRRG